MGAARGLRDSRVQLPVVNAIWIGPELGPIHVACLHSFLRHGHRVVLHCYERPKDTPKHIEIADAAKLLPAERVIRYRRSGGLSLFSNLLRYELLKSGLGLYVDCDVFCCARLRTPTTFSGGRRNDDIWFKAMSLMRDVPCQAIGGIHLMPEFKFKGSTTLSQLNQEGRGQDAALGQVLGHFGLTVDVMRAKEARLHSDPEFQVPLSA